jgi:hypothetical protein
LGDRLAIIVSHDMKGKIDPGGDSGGGQYVAILNYV